MSIDVLGVLIETYWNVKFPEKMIVRFLFAVLIETYWNVKTPEERLNTLETSINRNILECKAFWVHKGRVLCYVLIETYWNVKQTETLRNSHGTVGINRNILECKDL